MIHEGLQARNPSGVRQTDATLSTRMPVSLLAALDRAAERELISRAAVVRQALVSHLSAKGWLRYG